MSSEDESGIDVVGYGAGQIVEWVGHGRAHKYYSPSDSIDDGA